MLMTLSCHEHGEVNTKDDPRLEVSLRPWSQVVSSRTIMVFWVVYVCLCAREEAVTTSRPENVCWISVVA